MSTSRVALCLTPDAARFRQALFTIDSFTRHADSAAVDVLLLCEPRDVVPGWDPRRWPSTPQSGVNASQPRSEVAGPHVHLQLLDWSAMVAGLPVREWWTPAGHRRIFLPQVLPERYERFAWLDDDVYVARPGLAGALTADLAGHPVGALVDYWICNGGDGEMVRLGLAPEVPYLNGGLVVVDRHRWEEQQLTECMLAFMHDRPEQCRFPEQSPFNAVLRGDALVLERRYNRFVHQEPPDDTSIAYHFAGAVKPWEYNRWGGHPYWRRLYQRWFARSPWPELRRRSPERS